MTFTYQNVTVFRDFEPEEIDSLRAYMAEKTFSQGDIILEPGMAHSSLFIITSGTVRVIHNISGRELILASLEPGETFGELSFIEPGKSSAACRALTDVCVQVLERTSMDRLFDDHPRVAAKLWHALARDVKNRLLKTNENLASFFNISQSLKENEQFRMMYGTCFR